MNLEEKMDAINKLLTSVILLLIFQANCYAESWQYKKEVVETKNAFGDITFLLIRDTTSFMGHPYMPQIF